MRAEELGLGSKGSGEGGTGVVFVDPIGHLLGSHDREICRRLAARGHQVTLVTNSDYPFSHVGEAFEVATLFGGCVGDRHVLVKGLSYLSFFPRFWAKTRRLRPAAVILYIT